jgi:hypothetical protein
MGQPFNKFAKQYIGDIMEKEGFVPYKTIDFIRLVEDNKLLQSISFDSGTSGGYRYLTIGYLPLFIPHKRKDIGSTIAGRMHAHPPCGWSQLSWDFPKGNEETAEKSMLGIRDVILKYSIPYLNKYLSFTNVLKILEEDNPDIVPPLYRALFKGKAHYKGYFALGARNYTKAEEYFKEYYSLFEPEDRNNDISRMYMEELEEILARIHNPSEIEELMERNRQNTIEILNLRKYIDVD